MPRITHNHAAVAANHSLYQNELINESHTTLKEIATNTKNINLNVDTVEVSVDALEVLQAANNTTTSSIDTRLDNSIGAVNNSADLGEGSSQLRTVSLGYDRTGGKARSILVDSGGITQVHDSVIETTNNAILAKNTEVEISLNSLISANHTDLVALESSLTSMEGKIDTLDTVQDNALSKLTEIATNTANINVNVGDVEVNTNDLEVLQASTNSKLDHLSDNLDTLETSADALIAANHTDLVALEASLTSMEGKQDSLISANHTDLVALEASLTSMESKQDSIKTAVELLDNCVSGSEMQVDIVSSALPSGAATQTTIASILSKNSEIETSANAIQAAVEGTLTVGSHAVTNAGTFAVQAACSGTVTANLSATDNAVLDAIAADGDAIQGKLDTLETSANAIQAAVEGTLTVGSHAVTNAGTFAVQAACSGTVTANLSATDNAVLDAIAADGDAIQGKLDTLETSANAIQAAVEGTLTVGSHAVTNAGTFAVQSTVAAALPAGTNRIGMVGMKANQAADGSGTERFVLCDAAGHLQVDVLSGGGSTDVSGLSTHAKQDTIIGHLDGVEGKLDAIETTNNACQVLLGTIDADTGAIKTAVEILDNAISGNEMQVDVVSSALPSGAATQTTLASILSKNTEIETTNNANQVLLGTIDSDTDAIKTATEAIENAVHVDDAAYTLGTHSVIMMGGFAGTQAVGANDAGALAMTTTGFLKIVNPMTTTQLDDGKSVSAGGSTTSSILNVTHVPTGRITFVMDPAVISVGDIQIDSVQYSLDGTLYLQLYTENLSSRDATGHKLIQVKDFFAPHFRIHFTNNSGGSNETNLDIWAIY